MSAFSQNSYGQVRLIGPECKTFFDNVPEGFPLQLMPQSNNLNTFFSGGKLDTDQSTLILDDKAPPESAVPQTRFRVECIFAVVTHFSSHRRFCTGQSTALLKVVTIPSRRSGLQAITVKGTKMMKLWPRPYLTTR